MKHEITQIQKQEKSTHYSIVNVSSISGLIGTHSFHSLSIFYYNHFVVIIILIFMWHEGFRLNAPYAAVKHGVIGMTKSSALDVSY